MDGTSNKRPSLPKSVLHKLMQTLMRSKHPQTSRRMRYISVTSGVHCSRATFGAHYFNSVGFQRPSENPRSMSFSTSCGSTKSAWHSCKNSA